MKKPLLLLAFVLSAGTAAFAQANCNAGYETTVFPNSMNIPANTLFAIRVTAASAGTLTDLSMYNSGNSALNIKLAVYADNAGVPGNLVASTGPIALTMTAGVITTPVTPVAVAAGDYYLAGVIDASGSPIPVDNTTSLTLYGTSMSFASSFPASGTGFATIPGNPVNIWMNITCSTTGLPETAGNPTFIMSSYPSPVRENYFMDFHSAFAQQVTAEVYDCRGAIVLSQAISVAAGESSSSLSMTNLAPGIYFLRMHDASGNMLVNRKLIKE